MAGEQLFNDFRENVPRVLVVISDGYSSDDIVEPSEELRRAGIIIVTVGLGTHYNRAQLTVIASSPHEEHVFAVKFSQMPNIVMAVQDKFCKGKDQSQFVSSIIVYPSTR